MAEAAEHGNPVNGKPPPSWVALTFAAGFGAAAVVVALTTAAIGAAPLVLASLHCFDVSYGRRNSVVEVARLLGYERRRT